MRANQHSIRTILKNDFGPVYLNQVRRERDAHTKKLWEIKNKESRKAYWKAKRADPAYRAKELERKRKWREKNREKYNAYHRRYYEMNPARREYLSLKGKEFRAAKSNAG
jgi:hypothetical protein